MKTLQQLQCIYVCALGKAAISRLQVCGGAVEHLAASTPLAGAQPILAPYSGAAYTMQQAAGMGGAVEQLAVELLIQCITCKHSLAAGSVHLCALGKAAISRLQIWKEQWSTLQLQLHCKVSSTCKVLHTARTLHMQTFTCSRLSASVCTGQGGNQ